MRTVGFGIAASRATYRRGERRADEGPFQRPFAETVGAYAISLLVAALVLLLFQRIGPGQAWDTWVAWTIVLGLPATIGGAAGRLAV